MKVKVAAELGIGSVVLKSMVEVYDISKYIISLIGIVYFASFIKKVYSK